MALNLCHTIEDNKDNLYMNVPDVPQSLADALRCAVRGEVRFDRMSRTLYSTDASSYRIMPVGVVLPRDEEDLRTAVGIAADHKTPIIPRGGGTSLSGQTVGAALILDLSRYMDGILEINPEERWIRVEAGAVLDRINAVLRPHGLMVGPDPASSPAATIGGMTGNNSTGAHSIVYGMMADHVHEVRVVLADGSAARFGPGAVDSVNPRARQDTLEGKLYREVPQLLDRYAEDIETGYPAVWRNVAGYNLNRVQRDLKAGRPLNLVPLIVGSEGTLATVTSVKLGLVPRPARSRIAVVHFDSLREALDAVPVMLESKPASIELLDRFFIRLTRLSPEYSRRLTFVDGDPHILLFVEFAGEHEAAPADRAARMELALRRRGVRGAIVHRSTPAEIEDVWVARKAGFGLLMSRRGDAKPLSFADDAVVPVDRLTEFALEIERICIDAGVEPVFFAHASAGCLHINPYVNLKTAAGLSQMRTISEAVARLAIRLGGTTTGEHGEGLARSHYNEQLYGPRLHRAFRELKGLFDPENLMNPGKIVNAPAPWEPELLRIHPGYRTPLAPAATYLDFSTDGGFAGAVEMCNGQGLCRKRGVGVMCPSFMATREEAHSTRGRANALRAAMAGELGPEGLTSRELFEVLDLCLECKACRRECPSQVDMAKLKSEFLAHYQREHGVPLRSRLFGHVETINRLAGLFPRLANRAFASPVVRRLLDRGLGIDERCALPPLAGETFQKWFQQREAMRGRDVRPAPRGPVLLWDDITLSHNEPEIGRAAVGVLEAAGFEVHLAAGRRCDGRPLISKGLLAEARRNARHNVALLEPVAARGIPIVGVEPSSIAAFRDEVPDLLRSEAARRVAGQSFLIEELLSDLAERGELDLAFAVPERPRHILVHGHCHQKAIAGTAPLLRLLRLMPETTVEEIDGGCCGMAGSFGYEREHYDIAMACGEERLFPAVRSASMETIIAASGFSCRQHIAHGTGRKALHPIVVLCAGLQG